MVEFAFASMAFLLILFGVIEGGRLLFTYHEVSNAAREGARYAAAEGAHSGDILDDSDAVATHVQSVTAGLDWNRVTLQADWPGADEEPTCDDEANEPGCIVHVRVNYEYVPIVTMVFSGPEIPLESHSSMRIHY